MIVKNEEDVLGRCLSCVHELVDEIIIVDTGSEDKTKQIATQYTDLIYSFDWINDFSAARNFAFSKASMEYCMWLDADDVMEEKDRMGFLALKQSLTPDTDMVMMRYYMALDKNGKPSYWYYRERIIKNTGKYLWQGMVHEAITPCGNLIYSDVAVNHKKTHSKDPERNLNIYKKMVSEGKTLNARETYYYARELHQHKLYEEALEMFYKFMALPDAWVENKIEASVIMSDCYRKKGEKRTALQPLLQSLEYDVPRAEICCETGNYFMESGQYEIAAFWFETALSCRMDLKKCGFFLSDCYGFIPAIKLCVCYDKLGRYEKAEEYNMKAGKYKPDSPAFLYNKAYFEKKSQFAKKQEKC